MGQAIFPLSGRRCGKAGCAKNPRGQQAGNAHHVLNRGNVRATVFHRDIFWLPDEIVEEANNLPDPEVLAQKVVEDLEAALEQFCEIATRC